MDICAAYDSRASVLVRRTCAAFNRLTYDQEFAGSVAKELAKNEGWCKSRRMKFGVVNRLGNGRYTLFFCLALIAFAVGCSTQKPRVEVVPLQPDVAVVAKTLQGYQVGKTTVEDFVRDAALTNVTYPTRSYLNPGPPKFLMECTLKSPAGSPWMIYEVGVEQSLSGIGMPIRTRKYVVGDIHKPICILAFDQNGKLTGIKPVSPQF